MFRAIPFRSKSGGIHLYIFTNRICGGNVNEGKTTLY